MTFRMTPLIRMAAMTATLATSASLASAQNPKLSGTVTLVQGESVHFSGIAGVRKSKEGLEMLPGTLVFEPAEEAALSKGVKPGDLPAETLLSLNKINRIAFRNVEWKWDGNVNSGTELEVTYSNGKKETFAAESFKVAFERDDGNVTNLYWSWKMAEIVIAPSVPKAPAR